jgi:hypothetical protein
MPAAVELSPDALAACPTAVLSSPVAVAVSPTAVESTAGAVEFTPHSVDAAPGPTLHGAVASAWAGAESMTAAELAAASSEILNFVYMRILLRLGKEASSPGWRGAFQEWSE